MTFSRFLILVFVIVVLVGGAVDEQEDQQQQQQHKSEEYNCYDVSIECKIVAVKCMSANRVEQKLMELACPATCGYCGEPEETTTTTTSTTTSTTTTTLAPIVVKSRSSCFDESDDCIERYKYCTRRLYRRMMMIQCAKTCQFCVPGEDIEEEEVAEEEEDDEDFNVSREMNIRKLKTKLGKETVEKLKKMKIVDNVLALVKKPSTTQCVDRANDCVRTAKLCKVKKYVHIFRKLCSKTCNYCDHSPVHHFSDNPISVLDYVDDEDDDVVDDAN